MCSALSLKLSASAMDCRGMGALMNTGKRPLGLVFEILEAQYADDTAAVRRAEVLRIDGWAAATRDWLASQQPRTPLETYWWWRQKALILRAERLATPGGRCAKRHGGGWCRGKSHRFGLYAKCARHHGPRYGCVRPAIAFPTRMQRWQHRPPPTCPPTCLSRMLDAL